MSYTQFGYTYPSSSQLLMTGQHPATATPCCQPASPAMVEPPYAAGGAPQPTPAAAVCSLPAAYDSRLLSSFPRLATGLNGLYATSASTAYAAADPQGYVTAAALAAGSNPSFYSSLPNPYDLKESRGAWAPLSQGTAACYSYDPTGLAAYGPYGDRYSSMDSVARRKNATRETTNTLKAWLYEHRKNPYPTKGEKIMLAIITKMTLTQVSTWFANARRRLKKENKMTWEPRNKSADSADADDKEEEDDDDNNSSSPSPTSCDIRKKSPDNSCADDDDSQDMRVKSELANALPSERIKTSEFPSCSIKSESTELGSSSDCLALNLGSYASDHHQSSIMACSPEPDYHRRPGSPLSPQCPGPRPPPPPPLHHRHYDDRRNHPHQHSHHHHPMRPFHHQSAHPHPGTAIHPAETSPTDLCENDPLLTDDRPKIWSLAHTATSDSPPTAIKRPGNISPPLTQQLLTSSSGGEDQFPIDCNSPKTTPPPNAVHSTIPGGYSCGGGLPSHAPSEQGDVHRGRWLNGGGNGDCARTVSDCENGNKHHRYSSGIVGSYVGADIRRYGGSSGEGNTQMTNYNLDSTATGCFSPPKSAPTTTLFESCLESSANVATRSHTYKNDVSMVGSSSASSYMGGADLNSSSSSSSPGHRPPAAPSSSASSCDYVMQHHHSHGPVHHHHIKPPSYGNGETNSISSRPPIGEYGLENSSASTQGKHIRPDKEKIMSPENVGLAATSCLGIIR